MDKQHPVVLTVIGGKIEPLVKLLTLKIRGACFHLRYPLRLVTRFGGPVHVALIAGLDAAVDRGNGKTPVHLVEVVLDRRMVAADMKLAVCFT